VEVIILGAAHHVGMKYFKSPFSMVVMVVVVVLLT
jgi:hypothetical protein